MSWRNKHDTLQRSLLKSLIPYVQIVKVYFQFIKSNFVNWWKRKKLSIHMDHHESIIWPNAEHGSPLVRGFKLVPTLALFLDQNITLNLMSKSFQKCNQITHLKQDRVKKINLYNMKDILALHNFKGLRGLLYRWHGDYYSNGNSTLFDRK